MAKNLENNGKQICDIVPEDCSICHEVLDNARTVVKLQCNHQFHLDCIGSAYNAKNKMECPNCRNVEDGHWLYAGGIGRTPHERMLDGPPIVNVAPVVSIAQGRQTNRALVPPQGPVLPMVFHRHTSREPPAWFRSINTPISFGSFPPDYFHNNEAMMGGGSNGGGSSSNGDGASSSGEGVNYSEEGANGSEGEGMGGILHFGGESG